MHTTTTTIQLALFLFVASSHREWEVNGLMNFTHDVALHDDYHMWWFFNEQNITIKVRAKTTGNNYIPFKKTF